MRWMSQLFRFLIRYFVSIGHMNFVDYKRLRHSSKLIDLKEHRAQKTFYGHLFTSFPLSFQIDNVILSPFKTESSQVKERHFQAKEEKPLGLDAGSKKTLSKDAIGEKVEKISPVESGPQKVEKISQVPEVLINETIEGNGFNEDLLSCKNCAVGHLRVRKGFTPTMLKEQGLDILFLGSYPKKSTESSRCSFNKGERELLEKMAGAMKLKNGFAISRSLELTSGEKSNDLFEVVENDQEENQGEWLKSFLEEVELFKPKFVISLGAVPTNLLLQKRERLSQVHGKFFPRGFKLPNGKTHNVLICPIFHPEFLLINPNMKRTAWMDLQKVMSHFQKNLVKNSVEL